MKVWIAHIALCYCFFLCGSTLFAQGVSFFDTEHDAFIQEFSTNLSQSKGEMGRIAVSALQGIWNDSTMTYEEKDEFITLINIMVSKRFHAETGLAYLTGAYVSLKNGTSYVKIRPSEFMEMSLQCVTSMEKKRVDKYLRNMYEYLPEGYAIKREKFSWRISQNTPSLELLSLANPEGDDYVAPILKYDQTDLVYHSIRDSAHIYDTKGDFNLIARNFVGTEGRYNWAKMGLNADEVYCDFLDYKLNFHYGMIKVDTVDFYYTSLFPDPLRGQFEDLNVGYKNINKANYPYFKSHAGGVVIENFIPNVRYEGGFSLKGIRKIGSSYNVIVEAEMPEYSSGDPEVDSYYDSYSSDEFTSDETYEDEWGEDEWGEAAYEDSEFSSSDDESWDDEWDDEGYEEEGYEDEYGGDSYEDEIGYEEYEPDVAYLQQHILARLEILRGDTVIMKLLGEAFVLDQEKLVSKNLGSVIYTSDADSIYHPSMDLLYTVSDSTITLKKPKRGNLKSVPFRSSYHEYFLFFETIIWDLRQDEIQFTAFVDKENKVSAIESFDYFTKARFSQFKNVLKFNPIGAIYRYSVIYPDQSIFPESIIEDYNLPDQLIPFERALPGLEGSGFINYDEKSKEIIPLPKLFDWARAARNKKDYDAIQVISKVDTGAHAIMRLEDKNIEMFGVYPFSLSDSVYLRAVPLDEKVTVMSNRALKFGGALAVGKVNFYSSDEDRPSFTFDYDSYKIVCDSIDSMRFVLVRNPPLGYEPTPLEKALSNTVFEGITGAIHIDDPNNKSGKDRKKFRHFPVFDSYSNSYLYWAKPSIEEGVYTKEKMFFALDPFVLDSLEDFDDVNLNFEGEFNSSEIFPKFKQKLQVMEDFTLGFKSETPPSGYRIYNGNGRYYNNITLDGKGLRGEGTVEYLGTVAKSDSFIFHFDSVMAEIKDFNLRRGYRGGVYFPQVDAKTAQYKWLTKDSILKISSTFETLKIFNNQAEFTGTLSITDKGMVGNGELVLGEIKIVGDSIVFHEMDFETENSDFIIIDENDPEITQFQASDVSIKYDVWRHETSFENTELGTLKADFPIHQYKTTLSRGEYKRATKKLELEGNEAYLKDNYFVSTHPRQDSLNFKGQKATFDLATEEVSVNGVPNIFVADAMITPEDEKVTVQPNGLIKKLENAVIEADQETMMHRIYEAEVSIYTRHDYEGGGKYDYIEVNGKEQFINFANIKVNSDTTTIASGVIQESQAFYLTERIFFRGNTKLDASQKFLAFDGEVRIESENPVFKGSWLEFESAIVNPDSVFIPISDNLTDDFGNELTVGLNYVPENRAFYSNFLQAKEEEEDVEVISASGGLTFDRVTKEFRIIPEEKLKNRTYRGSTVSYNDAENTITSQGFLDFPYDFAPKTINLKMSGSWKEDLRKRKLSTNLIMGVDMSILPKEAMEKLSENLLFLTTNNKDIDFNQQAFLESISEILDEGTKGQRETMKFVENVKNSIVYTDIKLARQLPFTLLLSNIDFDYSRQHKALFSDSEVGLIGVNGIPINKMVNAKIVYKFGSIGADGEKAHDKLTLYLEVDEFNWVYYEFEEDVIYTLSSYYDDYNYVLEDLVNKRKGESGYRFELAPEEDIAKFRQDFVVKFIR